MASWDKDLSIFLKSLVHSLVPARFSDYIWQKCNSNVHKQNENLLLYSIKESIIKLRTLSTKPKGGWQGAGWAVGRHPLLSPKRVGHEALRQGKWPAALHRQPEQARGPLSHKAAHDHHSSIEISATGIQGLQATYHQVLDEVGVPPAWTWGHCTTTQPVPQFFSGLQLWNEDRYAEPVGMARPYRKTQHSWSYCSGYRAYLVKILPCNYSKNWSLLAVNFFAGTAGSLWALLIFWRYNQELRAKANKQWVLITLIILMWT